ncbi:hypothetical protein OROMI_017668 [Orobanche minor]
MAWKILPVWLIGRGDMGTIFASCHFRRPASLYTPHDDFCILCSRNDVLLDLAAKTDLFDTMTDSLIARLLGTIVNQAKT